MSLGVYYYILARLGANVLYCNKLDTISTPYILEIDIVYTNGFVEPFTNARRFVYLYLVSLPTCANLKRLTLALSLQSF